MNMQNFGAPWAEQIFDKGEESQINGIEQISPRSYMKTSSNYAKIQTYRTSNKQDQERNSPTAYHSWNTTYTENQQKEHQTALKNWCLLITNDF